MELRACDNLCESFRAKPFHAAFLFSCLQAPPSTRHSGSSSSPYNIFLGAQKPWALGSLGRTSAIVVILPFVGHLPGSMSLDYTIPLSVLSHLTVVPSLYLLAVKNFYCQSSGHSHILLLWNSCIWLHPWKEVGSETSYYVILVISLCVNFRNSLLIFTEYLAWILIGIT